jgi:glycosyltransferase involved in cell wall biosynthesis
MTNYAGRHNSFVLAIAWERHRRMDEMCVALGLSLVVLESRRRRLVRYWELACRTLQELRRVRPRVLFVQNPSIMLAALAVILRPWFGYRLVIDAHNEAVRPHIHDTGLVRYLSRQLLRAADLTIVTNAELAKIVIGAGGRPAILHDRVPNIELTSPPPIENGVLRVAVICTFAPDEPLEEVFEAARLSVSGFRFFVTGRSERAPRELLKRKPSNVRLTGFLSEPDYWDLLRSVHAVVDLTAMPDCLVCGSYEAIAVGRPLVLTDTPAGCALFGKSACFTRNKAGEISAALRRLRDEYPSYVRGAVETRTSLGRSWDALAAKLLERVRSWLDEATAARGIGQP